MGREKIPLLPTHIRLLKHLGENIKLARLRRRLSAEQVAQRAGISRVTLWSLEKGSSAVSIGVLLQVLSILGLERDLSKLGEDDELGRKLEDAKLLVKKRAPKQKKL